jgi:CubicO group peptidase (beta-lactamase class C family)
MEERKETGFVRLHIDGWINGLGGWIGISGLLCLVSLSWTGACSPDGRAEADPLVVPGQPLPAAVIAPLLERHGVPGMSIATVHEGRIDWSRGYGFLERGKPERVDTATLFQAASISKPVAAVAALQMVANGQLLLDEDVSGKLVSWTIPPSELTKGSPVTLRGLLSHSAGLTMHGVPEFAVGDSLPTLVQILDGTWSPDAVPVRLFQRPGTGFSYSGGGYIVLQLLLTDVAKRPFAELARELVLGPAGMASSTFEQPLPEHLHARAAVGHDRNGRPLEGGWHVLPEQAAGGLWTTPRDLASFMLALWRAYHGDPAPLLPQALARDMLTRQIDDFGLGLSLPRAGVSRFQHGGGNAGYRCFMVLSVVEPEGIVIMTNADSGEDVIQEVFDLVAGSYGWSH